MHRRRVIGIAILLAALVVGAIVRYNGEHGDAAPALTTAVRAEPVTITDTKYLPLVFGRPGVETRTVTPHDAAQFHSGGETWDEAKAGGDLYLFGPNGTHVKAEEQAPGGTLAIYAFGRTIVYFDLSDIADPADGRVAGDLTLTYYHDSTRQPLDLSYDLLFRRAPTSPATKDYWSAFDTWPLLATRPVESTVGVTRTVTLDAAAVAETDDTLPQTLAIGIQTSEPYLSYGQSLSSGFHLPQIVLRVPTRVEERSHEQ